MILASHAPTLPRSHAPTLPLVFHVRITCAPCAIFAEHIKNKGKMPYMCESGASYPQAYCPQVFEIYELLKIIKKK